MEAPTTPAVQRAGAVPPWGRLLALFGGALLVLSSVLAWAQQPFAPPDVPGIHPTEISVPALLTRSVVRVPTLGLVLSLLGLAAVLLATLPGRPADLGRRAFGVLAVVLVLVFLVRLSPMLGDRSLLSALLVGFYLAAAGSLLTVLAGRSLRRS